jgi:hypothetical protein
VEVELVGDRVEPRHQRCTGDGQAASQAAGGPGTGEITHVDPVVGEIDVGQAVQTPPQQLHLGRRRPLLRREHLGGIDEARTDVAQRHQLEPTQPVQRVQRPQRPQPAVRGCGPAQANQHPAGPAVDGDADQLARPHRRRGDRVVAVGATDQLEPRCTRHLDHRRAPIEAPLGLDRVSEGSRHGGAPVGAAQDLERALATVRQRHRVAVPAGGRSGAPQGRRHVAGAGGPPKLVGRGQEAHDRTVWPNLPIRSGRNRSCVPARL